MKHDFQTSAQISMGIIGLFIGFGMVACDAPQPLKTPTSSTSLEAEKPVPWDPPGRPSFLVPPHEREKSDMFSAKMSSGYNYAEGAFSDDLTYGIYTYIDDEWMYVSVSVWDVDGSTITSGTDLGSTGELWTQIGSYQTLDDGTSIGDYYTSYLDDAQVGTFYITEYAGDASESTYSSTIDYSNTIASPDCLYESEWKDDYSTSFQTCVRDDNTYWDCNYEYIYISEEDDRGETIAVDYISEQICNDSSTTFEPDYTYVDEMSWDYVTGDYVDYATMTCWENSEIGWLERTFTWIYEDGVGTWYDETGKEIAEPSCSWEPDQEG